MPDIGFSELLIVVFIAIVVLGPEKLPEAMVKLGRFVGKIRRMWDDATRDIKKEIELEEMKEEMQKYKKQLPHFKNSSIGIVVKFNSPFINTKFTIFVVFGDIFLSINCNVSIPCPNSIYISLLPLNSSGYDWR